MKQITLSTKFQLHELDQRICPAVTAGTHIAVGADAGGGSVVNTYDAIGNLVSSVNAFPGFTGGVRVAVADFNGDFVPDIVVGTGPGGPSQVKILDGKTHAVLFSTNPFEASFTGGVFVASGDLNGDDVPDLVISADQGGGPRVRVFDGKSFKQIADFFAIDDPNFRGGVRPAVGDIAGNGYGDLVVSAGFGGGPRIAAFDGKSLATTPVKLFADFFAFEPTLVNGAYVTVGDINGDGHADIIVGAGPGGGPRVSVFDGAELLTNTQKRIVDFFSGNANNRGGIRVAAVHISDSIPGLFQTDLVTGSGNGDGSRVTAYTGVSLTTNPSSPGSSFGFDAFPGFTGGIFVG